MTDPSVQSDLSKKESLELYENGKKRRYNLLFAVNGGAFGIVKLLAGGSETDAEVLGGLSLLGLAFGMVFFTIIMVVDIFMFGRYMNRKDPGHEVFKWPGWLVLIGLGLLLCGGWVQVSGVLPF